MLFAAFAAREIRFKRFLPDVRAMDALPIAREIRFKRFLRVGFKAEPYP
jgi:hypothetical protein